MGLLQKALYYRQNKNFNKKIKKNRGLLNRALDYLDHKEEDADFKTAVIENFQDSSLLDNGVDLKAQAIEDEDYLEEKIELVDDENAFEVSGKYFSVINQVADDLSALTLHQNAGQKFFQVITDNFNFSKAVFLIYSHVKEKFIFWQGSGISAETKQKFEIDLSIADIYHELATEQVIFSSSSQDSSRFQPFVSEEDFLDSNFFLFIPFVFSGHIIGIYCGLKLNDLKFPDENFISALQTIGHLNGAMLYNIYQQEKMSIASSQQEQVSTAAVSSGIDVDDQLEAEAHDSVETVKVYINTLLSKNEVSVFSVVYIKFSADVNEGEFQFVEFYSDIQFIVMNVVGTNAYVEIMDNLDIYIVLPDMSKAKAKKRTDEVVDEIKRIFLEVTDEITPEFTYNIKCYPDDATDIDALLMIE